MKNLSKSTPPPFLPLPPAALQQVFGGDDGSVGLSDINGGGLNYNVVVEDVHLL